MCFSLTNVQTAFNSRTTVRSIIIISTLLALLILITTGILVGFLVGTVKIKGFTQIDTILIYESNMSLILDQQNGSDYTGLRYLDPLNTITLENFIITLNETLRQAFPDSYLDVITSTLSYVLTSYNSPISRYTCKAKAFFKEKHISDEIEDALELFQPGIATFGSNMTYIGSEPATVNRALSNVTDALLTTLTLADLPYITITNSTTFH